MTMGMTWRNTSNYKMRSSASFGREGSISSSDEGHHHGSYHRGLNNYNHCHATMRGPSTAPQQEKRERSPPVLGINMIGIGMVDEAHQELAEPFIAAKR